MPKEKCCALVSMTIGDHTGVGKYCTLPVLPAQIKHAKGNKDGQTHAILDPGRNATICTEILMNELKHKMHPPC